MPWQESTIVTERRAFCGLAERAEVPFGELCHRFGISRPTGYLWVARYRAEGAAGLADRSHRPHTSPRQTAPEMETLVCAARAQHPTWGGRKLHHWLVQQGHAAVPAPSTITAIVRRHGYLDEPSAPLAPRWQRCEADVPNALGQLDFTSTIQTRHGRCTPLLVLDDHSRSVLALAALPDQSEVTVQACLTGVFRQYGLPWRILGDKGGP